MICLPPPPAAAYYNAVFEKDLGRARAHTFPQKKKCDKSPFKKKKDNPFAMQLGNWRHGYVAGFIFTVRDRELEAFIFESGSRRRKKDG